MTPALRGISVLYDERCELCRRVARWLVAQPAYVRIDVWPMNDPATRARFPAVVERVAAGEFVVVDDRGGVYVDTDARILCLWALPRWRRPALRLARPGWRERARQVFDSVSRNRYRLSRLLPSRRAS